MAEDLRNRFKERLSSVGWGTRESVQMLLGAVVADIRDEILRDKFDDDELPHVVAFHDRAENLWREAIATNPPLEPRDMLEGLRKLHEACALPALSAFEGRLARGVRLANAFAREHAP